MVQTDQDQSTQCAVYDQTPDSEQKKINIVVRPIHTIERVISNIKTQYRYDSFDLVLQPNAGSDLIYLNDRKSDLIYSISEFEPKEKNVLVLLPSGKWDGNVKARYSVPKPAAANKALTNGSISTAAATSAAAAAMPSPAPAAKVTQAAAAAPSSTASPKMPATQPPASAPAPASASAPSPLKIKKKLNDGSSNVSSKTSSDAKLHSASSKSSLKTARNGNIEDMVSSTTACQQTNTAAADTEGHPAPTPPPPPPPPPPTVSPSTGEAAVKSSSKTQTVTKVKRVKKSTTKSTKAKSESAKNTVVAAADSTTVESVSPAATEETNNLANSMNELNGKGPNSQQQNAMNINDVDDFVSHDIGMSPPSSMTTVTNATNSDSLNLSPMSEPLSDDDLALGASASPTETEPIKLPGVTPLDHNSSIAPQFNANEAERKYRFSSVKDQLPSVSAAAINNGYVGLVNQAMTCYLNSLLQALYMTPEFRNALYRWEFDNDNEAKNIPYQLQKLFLNLQTSKKSAVETTDLTRSFGWNSSEAWQQHDIQELCRVMFDALEHKFKNTKQANLISTLYEGKMLDYVKCLECDTEKTRADTFLDIPLPVRPFGSEAAYGSIEEALRAFVQPETLNGNNQYFCEKCNKKCDAHKGLKFTNFPYILTLHLKRFDFDYSTMHRIKLNDKVTYPQVLNLNAFVATDSESVLINNMDNCSTTGSNSAMEEDNWSSGVGTTASSTTQNGNDSNEEDPDEGIDMSSNSELRNRSNGDHQSDLPMGPYTYELFAIMIHSGSASGGHYYAYIKELDNNEWFCFNDQTVSPITQEDIQKSFGGNPTKSYYSNLYSSSTNAYMLMYRQMDRKRNEKSVKPPEFPPHINQLMEKLKEEEETRITHGSARHRNIINLSLPEQIKQRVYFYNPQLKKLKMTRVYVSQQFDINAILQSAYDMLSVKQFAPLSNCRLVGYDPTSERIVRSFEDVKDPSLTEIRANLEEALEFLLEYRTDDQTFETYEPGGTTWYVYLVKLATMEMDGPFFVYSPTFENNDTLRRSISTRLNLKEELMMVKTTQRFKKAFVTYDTVPTEEAEQRLEKVAQTLFRSVTHLYLNVPNTEPSNLEVIGIPTGEVQDQLNDQLSEVAINDAQASDSTKLVNGFHPECNSEDSSLSDGDRTLVENLQLHNGVGSGGCGDSQISSTSHSPQLSSPDDENIRDSLNRVNAFYNGYSHGDGDQPEVIPQTPQFFHAIKLEVMDIAATSTRHTYSEPDTADDAARKPVVSYKILVDSNMRLSKLKEHVQNLIQVPGNYFQLNHKHDKNLKPLMNRSLMYFGEGETLSVELGKELEPDEHRAKVFYMRLSELSNETGRLPCVCEWIYTDATTLPAAKSALISKLQRIDAEKYKSLCMENCRLWLKGGRSLTKIFTDDEGLTNSLRTTSTIELLIQECEDGQQPQVDDSSLTIFVRRWHPDTLQLDKFEEITLNKNSELRNVLNSISGIPEENLAYSKVNGSFPYTSISLLTINSAMSWFSIPATLDNYPLSSTISGNLYFYKDASVEAKELTPEERKEMIAKEKTRLDRLGCMSSSRFSPRRERALKIYLDSPIATASPPVDANSSLCDD